MSSLPFAVQHCHHVPPYLLGVQSAILAGKLEERVFFSFFFYPFYSGYCNLPRLSILSLKTYGGVGGVFKCEKDKGGKGFGVSILYLYWYTKGIEGGKRHGFSQREMFMESPPSPSYSTISGRIPFFPITIMWPPGINKRRTVHVRKSNCTMDTCI